MTDWERVVEELQETGYSGFEFERVKQQCRDYLENGSLEISYVKTDYAVRINPLGADFGFTSG